MDRQQIGMKLVLQGLELPLKLTTFDDRLVLQKAIYLAQAAGVDVGYGFKWYLKGPYSPGLTRDAFAVVAEIESGEDESANWCLDTASQRILGRIQDLMPSNRSSRATRLECLASIHYLMDRGDLITDDPTTVRQSLSDRNKEFDLKEIEVALEQLRSHDLLPTHP